MISKFANANTVVTTGWSTPTNAYDTTSAIYNALTNKPASGGGEGSQAFATAAPGKNSSITTDYGFPAFSTSDIPDGSVINSVTVEIRYKSSTTGSTGAVIGLQINKNGTLLGSESTFGMNLSDQTVTKADTSLVVADLRTANQLKARLRGGRTTSNTAITWSVDYVRVIVDYTPTSTLDLSQTLAPALLAAAAVAVQGALAKVLGLGLSAAGALLVKADLSRTLGVTLAADAKVLAKVDASLALAPTLSATGTVSNPSTTLDASLVLAPALAADAAVRVAANAALALTPALASTAQALVRADAALTLPVALASQGVVRVAADLAAPFAPALAATAGALVQAEAAGLALAPALDARAGVRVQADASLTLPLALAATISQGQTSTVDAGLVLPLALTADAAVRVKADCALVLALAPVVAVAVPVKGDGVFLLPVALGADGQVLIQGEALLPLAPTLEATAHVPSTGRVWSYTDPAPPPAGHEAQWAAGTVAPPTGYTRERTWTWTDP